MDSFIKTLHSHNRNLVLLVAVIVILASAIALLTNKKWAKHNKILSLIYLIVMDIQALIGFILYLGLSEFGIKLFFNSEVNVMQNPYRQIAVEHFALMILALVLVHLGYRKIKVVDDKHKAVLLYFGLSLLFMLAGIPWDRL